MEKIGQRGKGGQVQSEGGGGIRKERVIAKGFFMSSGEKDFFHAFRRIFGWIHVGKRTQRGGREREMRRR